MSDRENDHIFKLKDGRNLAYSLYGSDKGKTLFYFHGWPSSRLSGLETDEAAKKLGLRVVSIDRPGFGLSDFKKNRTLLDWPDDVLELADSLKINKFSVMGVSGGGPYAAVCAYKIPQRLVKAGIVAGLAPPTIKKNLEGMPLDFKISWLLYPKSSLFRDMAGFWVDFQNRYLPILNHFGFKDKEDRKLMTIEFQQKFRESVRESLRKGIKGPVWDLYLYTKDWGFNLGDIKAKVYLWYGATDRNAPPAMGKYYASQIPGSTLTVLEGGHLCRKAHMEKILKALTTNAF